MFEFKTAPPSKALAYGTNMSCLDDRLYVCRLNKHFVINNDKNTVVLEAGDIVVCHNAYDKSYGSDKKIWHRSQHQKCCHEHDIKRYHEL